MFFIEPASVRVQREILQLYLKKAMVTSSFYENFCGLVLNAYLLREYKLA